MLHNENATAIPARIAIEVFSLDLEETDLHLVKSEKWLKLKVLHRKLYLPKVFLYNLIYHVNLSDDLSHNERFVYDGLPINLLLT